jgi:hypothetical protein
VYATRRGVGAQAAAVGHEPSLTVLDWLPHSRRSSVAIDLSACEE